MSQIQSYRIWPHFSQDFEINTVTPAQPHMTKMAHANYNEKSYVLDVCVITLTLLS